MRTVRSGQVKTHPCYFTNLHNQNTCVWLALSCRRSVGPVFFSPAVEDETNRDVITQFVSVLDKDECCSKMAPHALRLAKL